MAKHIIRLLIGLFLLNADTLFAQDTYKSQNIFEFSIGYGNHFPTEKIQIAYAYFILEEYGSYLSEIDDYFDDDIYTGLDTADEGKYGGPAMSVRFLLSMNNSFLKIGGGIGIFQIRAERVVSSSLVWKDTGKPYSYTSYLNGQYLQLLADTYLFSVNKMIFHSEIGLGLLNYWDSDMDFGKSPLDPSTELMSSAKFILSIPTNNPQIPVIEPQIIITKGYSDLDLFTYHFHLGLAWSWQNSNK